MRALQALLTIFLLPSLALAGLRTEVIRYKHGDKVLEGYLAVPEGLKGKIPGVLVVHEWKGHGPYSRMRADMLAGLGYAAFALDMYGKGVYAKDHEEAAKLMGAVKGDPKLLRARARAGLEVLAGRAEVDTTKLAGIGYCFGGATVLELARDGADLKGVVSFHGALDTKMPADAKTLKTRILVCHGADDKWVAGGLGALEAELKAAKANFQVISYPGAVHSFTVKDAGNDPSLGLAYNEAADKKSWDDMKKFLAEVFR